jgi:GNAT superfamily N-acetyltransferase
MKITIRKALPGDAYDYTLCHIACWQAAYRGIVPDEFLNKMPAEAERRTERFRQSLSGHDREFYCVMNENRMVGRLIFGKSRDEDKSEAGEIDAIYLIKEFWGKGHGKEMLDFAMKRLKSMGYSEVILWTLEENSRGRRFYEKHGFVLDSSKKELEFGKSLTCVRYVFNINEGENI